VVQDRYEKLQLIEAGVNRDIHTIFNLLVETLRAVERQQEMLDKQQAFIKRQTETNLKLLKALERAEAKRDGQVPPSTGPVAE